VPVKETLPADIDRRLADLGDVIAATSPVVEFAYVFGSTASARDRTPRSDIDLAVYVAEGADAASVCRDVAYAAAKHLGTDAIDILALNTAPTSLAGRVLGRRLVILDRVPWARHRYESVTLRMFHDFRIREHRRLADRYRRG
jgi:predicted nucleotidyltransferase